MHVCLWRAFGLWGPVQPSVLRPQSEPTSASSVYCIRSVGKPLAIERLGFSRGGNYTKDPTARKETLAPADALISSTASRRAKP
jgi:hypothetical protein